MRSSACAVNDSSQFHHSGTLDSGGSASADRSTGLVPAAGNDPSRASPCAEGMAFISAVSMRARGSEGYSAMVCIVAEPWPAGPSQSSLSCQPPDMLKSVSAL